MKGDSVHYLIPADTTLDQPITILAFIDKEEDSPYREIISQSLQSKGYWIYYACYDTLGNECFLPEFYDIDFEQQPMMGWRHDTDRILNLSHIGQNTFQVDDSYFYKSYTSDSLKLQLKQIVQNRFRSEKRILRYSDTLNNNYIWKNRLIAQKIWKLNPNISISTNTIKHNILTLRRRRDFLPDSIPFSDIRYLTKYKENIKAASISHLISYELLEQTLSNYETFKNNLDHFTKEELQQLPSQIFLTVVYEHNVNSIWFMRPPLPPPPPPSN